MIRMTMSKDNRHNRLINNTAKVRTNFLASDNIQSGINNHNTLIAYYHAHGRYRVANSGINTWRHLDDIFFEFCIATDK